MLRIPPVIIAPTLCALALVGCSSGDGGAPPPAGAPTADAGTEAGALDDGGGAADSGGPRACATADAVVPAREALLDLGVGDRTRTWIIRALDGKTLYTVVVREERGAQPGAPRGDFGAEQLQPPQAPVSLQVQTGCTAHDDHYHCGASFVPVRGSWAFEALPAAVGGKVVLQITADLAAAKVSSATATLTPGGATMCVDRLHIEGTVTAP